MPAPVGRPEHELSEDELSDDDAHMWGPRANLRYFEEDVEWFSMGLSERGELCFHLHLKLENRLDWYNKQLWPRVYGFKRRHVEYWMKQIVPRDEFELFSAKSRITYRSEDWI